MRWFIAGLMLYAIPYATDKAVEWTKPQHEEEFQSVSDRLAMQRMVDIAYGGDGSEVSIEMDLTKPVHKTLSMMDPAIEPDEVIKHPLLFGNGTPVTKLTAL